MTTGHAPHEAPQDERWLAHLREVSDGVVPPTAVDPHALSRVAVRRTRLRRTALATGGGLATVAVVAATAFALSTPAMGTLLPGAAPVAASAPADGTDPARGVVTDLPDGWHSHDLEGLSYALPPDIVTSGPVSDEPGVTSQMWHSRTDPDTPPFLYMAYHADGELPGVADLDGEEFDLPGAKRAIAIDSSALVMGLPQGAEVPDAPKGATIFAIEPDDGPGAWYLSINTDDENLADEIRETFVVE